MADKANKTAGNVSGRFYVDESCIACGLCISMAAANFSAGAGDKAFVAKQPDGAGESGECAAARDACPVSAIGDDGA